MDEIETQAVRVEAVKYVTATSMRELGIKVNNHIAQRWALYGPFQQVKGQFIQTLVIPSGLPLAVQNQALSIFDED